MRPLLLTLLTSLLGLSVSPPAFASLEGRSGLPSGIHVGMGLAGISLDAVAGPIAFGGAVAGINGMGSMLIPSVRAIWTVRDGQGLSAGVMATAMSALDTNTPPYGGTPPVRVLMGEVGLAVSYRYDVPDIFGRTLPLTLSPILTFMIDPNGNVKFGPQTSLEFAARFTPEAELTIGGGTIVGMRFKL